MRFIINTSLKSNSKEKTKKKQIRKKTEKNFFNGKKRKIGKREKNKKQVLIKVAVFPSCRPMEYVDPTPGTSGLEHAHDQGREVPVLPTHSLHRSIPDTCQGTRLGWARPYPQGATKGHNARTR